MTEAVVKSRCIFNVQYQSVDIWSQSEVGLPVLKTRVELCYQPTNKLSDCGEN